MPPDVFPELPEHRDTGFLGVSGNMRAQNHIFEAAPHLRTWGLLRKHTQRGAGDRTKSQCAYERGLVNHKASGHVDQQAAATELSEHLAIDHSGVRRSCPNGNYEDVARSCKLHEALCSCITCPCLFVGSPPGDG